MFFGEENKDANQRHPGRRHQVTEVETVDGMPSYYTEETANQRRASEAQRNQNIENMSKGPSFLDRMQQEKEVPQRQHKAQPTDGALNVFDWNDTPQNKPKGAGGKRQNGGGRQGIASDLHSTPPAVSDAESKRQAEADKFENHGNSNFLNFSENGNKREAPKKGGQAPQNGGGMMDALQRGQPNERPRGKRQVAH